MITGIKWVSELIEIAGGEDVFVKLSGSEAAKDRIVTSEQVIKVSPDVIIASWCGKKVRDENIRKRDGWASIPAVYNNRIYEIKSPLILQPGPAALSDGLDRLKKIIRQFLMEKHMKHLEKTTDFSRVTSTILLIILFYISKKNILLSVTLSTIFFTLLNYYKIYFI